MKNRIKIYIFIIINQNFIYIYLNYFSIMKNRIELFTILYSPCFTFSFNYYIDYYLYSDEILLYK